MSFIKSNSLHQETACYRASGVIIFCKSNNKLHVFAFGPLCSEINFQVISKEVAWKELFYLLLRSKIQVVKRMRILEREGGLGPLQPKLLVMALQENSAHREYRKIKI